MSRGNLAKIYLAQAKYDNAEQACKQSMESLNKSLGPDHPQVTVCTVILATIYLETKKLDEQNLSADKL